MKREKKIIESKSLFILLFLYFAPSVFSANFYWAFEPAPESSFAKYSSWSFFEKRDSVVEALKNHSDSTLSEPMSFLRSLEARGLVSSIKKLWICNTIRFSADYSAVRIIESSGIGGHLRESIPKDALLFDRTKAVIVPSPGDSVSWGVVKIGAPRIWENFGIDGSGVLVALLDSGLDFGNPDLSGAIWTNTGEIPMNGVDDDSNGYIDDIHGWDWTGSDAYPHDERGHGTHVAGTIGGRGALGIGTGVAPGCQIMPLKILNRSGSGVEANVWEAIQYAIENGARVMNLSIGWRYSSEPDRAMWRTVVENACAIGIVMCIAGGNEGGYPGAPNNLRTPGDVPRAITVGATTILDSIASFSSLGPVAWDTIPGYWDYPYPPGLIKPDITAPGDSVISSVLGGGYFAWDGTSMACPHIAGASALLIQFDPSLSHDTIKTLIENCAIDLGPVGKDSIYGSGRIDLEILFDIINGMGWVIGTTTPGGIVQDAFSRAWVFADSSGNYIIKLSGGLRDLVSDAFGYEPLTRTVDVIPAETVRVDFPLYPGIPFTMRFVVRDFSDGSPIPDVGLYIKDFPLGILWTDDRGRINLPISERDASVAVAFKPGYISDSESVNVLLPDTALHALYLHRAMDFESDSLLSHDGTSSSGRDDWEWGAPRGLPIARSGSRLWGTRLDTTYSDTTNSWLYLGEMDLSGDDVEAPMVVFWHWFELEATPRGCWDGGNLKATTGSEWEIVQPVGGYPCFLDPYNPITGGQPGFSGERNHLFWDQVAFPMDRFIGTVVSPAIHMGSDDNTTRRGWFIDDLALLHRTKREPIFRGIAFSVDSFSIAVAGSLLAVSDPINRARCFLHYRFISGDSLILPISGEAFSTIIHAPFPNDTVEFWFSAEDASGRRAVFPPGAPDSTIIVPITPGHIEESKPKKFSLSVFPNPFNGALTLKLEGSRNEIAPEISIYDICGRSVRKYIVDNTERKSEFSLIWDATDFAGKTLPTGIYLVTTKPSTAPIRVVLIK